MPAFFDRRGIRYGRLVVKAKSRTRTNQGNIMWTCVCDCGATVKVAGSNLTAGTTRSCGCLAAELVGINSNLAKRMIARCGSYISSESPVYKQAGVIIAKAKREKIKVEFETIAHLALYLQEITPKRCPVFGFKFQISNKGPLPNSPSADRIDPKKGYVPGNIQVVSMLANRMKRDATPKELKQFARWVLEEHNA